MIEELVKIYVRDLDRLKSEVEAFNEENNLWLTKGSIRNPAGNLCLHIIGNLKTYIGKNIGGYRYIRDRDSEFNLKNVSKQELMARVEETKSIVSTALTQMPEAQLEELYTENVLGYEMTNAFFLIHLAAHLSYHLGQINYIRRVLE